MENIEETIKRLMYEIIKENKSIRRNLHYEEFKIMLAEYIMYLIYKTTDYTANEEEVDFSVVKSLGYNVEATSNNINTILVTNEIMKNLYKGDKTALITLFHELGHIRINYETNNLPQAKQYFNRENLLILKESYLDEYIGFNYDRINKNLLCEEHLAEFIALKRYEGFINSIDLNFTKKELETHAEKEYNLRDSIRQEKRIVDNFVYLSDGVYSIDVLFKIMLDKNKEAIIPDYICRNHNSFESSKILKR